MWVTGCWMGAGGLVSLCSQRGAGCAAGKSAVPCPSVGQGCAAGERPNVTQTNSVGKEAGGRQKLSLPRAHLELSRASSHTHTHTPASIIPTLLKLSSVGFCDATLSWFSYNLSDCFSFILFLFFIHPESIGVSSSFHIHLSICLFFFTSLLQPSILLS